MKDFKTLLESTVLNDESKAVIKEAFESAVAEAAEAVKVEYETKLVEEKAELVKLTAAMVDEIVAEEVEALKEEIEQARSMEVRYVEKLETFKEEYVKTQEEKVKVQIQEAVAEEVEALKEEIEEARKVNFVLSMFEAYKENYQKLFVTEGDANKLEETVKALEEAQKELDSIKRDKIISNLTEGLTGRKLAVAKTILEDVATDKLEAKFESVRSIILEAESEDGDKKPEDKDGDKKPEDDKNKKPMNEGKVVLDSDQLNEDANKAVQEKLKKSLQNAKNK